MTTPIQAANVSHAIDCGYVQAARRRLDEVPLSKAVLLEPPTLFDLEEALGERVQRCELWEGNWRNRVYRLELARGGAAVAKQLIVGTDAKFQCEYDQLGRLARLRLPGLRVPAVLALLPAKRTYVMELAPGKTIPRLVRDLKRLEDLLTAAASLPASLPQVHLP